MHQQYLLKDFKSDKIVSGAFSTYVYMCTYMPAYIDIYFKPKWDYRHLAFNY